MTLSHTITIVLVWLAAVSEAISAATPQLTILHEGVGDILPIGRPAGIQVLIDPGDLTPGTYLLEWETETPDGDTLVKQRAIPLAGQPATAWIYNVVPRGEDSAGRIRVRRQGEAIPLLTSPIGSTAGMTGQLPEGSDLMLVVGSRGFGLESYDAATNPMDPRWSHIDSRVKLLTPDELPDRPEGLSAASTLLWTGDQEVPDPHRESVIQDWMEAGGHLIVSIPDRGRGGRFARTGGSLHALLPDLPEQEALYTSQILQLLSPDQLRITPGTEMTCRPFPATTSGTGPWHTVLNLPDGRPIAIARPVGHGRLTLIGLDLTSPIVQGARSDGAAQGPLPAAATFWNPVLARRGDAPTLRELAAISKIARKSSNLWGTSVQDSQIAWATRRTVAAGSRLSIVILWLGICWLIGGPVLWIVLGRLHRRDLAWPIFAILGGIGGVIGWFAGLVVSLQSPEALHMSIVDKVVGTPESMVRSWIDVRIPGVNTHELSVPAEEGRGMLAPWIPSGQPAIGFADSDTLIADVNRPESLPIKARSTSTSVQLEWIGPLAPDSSLPEIEIVQPVHVSPNGLEGTLRYSGPRPLKNVSVVWIQSRRYPRETSPITWTNAVDSGHMPVVAWSWKLSRPVNPEQEFSLQALKGPQLAQSLADHVQSLKRSSGVHIGTIETATTFEILTLYRLATPPGWQMDPNTVGSQQIHADVHRVFGSQLDLGARLGSPMLLISGFIDDTDLPVPLLLDESPIQATGGLTMLRWILPLPDVSPTVEQWPPRQ